MKVIETFKEAIDLTYERARAIGSDNPRAYNLFQDYLAQKFTVAMLKHPDSADAITELWKSITEGKDESRD